MAFVHAVTSLPCSSPSSLYWNAADLNFAVFNRILFPGQLEGFFFTLFSIGVAAAETAVALAIIINVYRNYHSDQVNSIENIEILKDNGIQLCIFDTSSAIPELPGSGTCGYEDKRPVAALIGTVLMGCVFAMSVYTAYEYFFAVGRDASTGMYPTVTVFNFTWLKFTGCSPSTSVSRLSPISILMLIVITTVSFMVHIYSFGYMAERDENYKVEEYEKGMQRFYAYLSLFTMSMLGLVVATNIFQMYLFWELVGVCSYLLIGFYYPKHAAVHASKKAFIVTRFADLFFLIGILFYSFYVGTFNYDLNAQPRSFNSALAGAAWVMPTASCSSCSSVVPSKSAMFPLHIWLPDAMERSNSCFSALIHAATMVVAGVSGKLASSQSGYSSAPEALHYVAYIAAFTAFYAAAVACCQRDIKKRGLAFSTISQIAYMLVALGVCFAVDNHHGGLGYMAGIFHLFTHAMFKALLFLCSGAIIVIIGSNFKEYMGGLHKYMPITNICFLIGCLAIPGIPPFAGFWSKDEIISACFQFSPFMGWFMTDRCRYDCILHVPSLLRHLLGTELL